MNDRRKTLPDLGDYFKDKIKDKIKNKIKNKKQNFLEKIGEKKEKGRRKKLLEGLPYREI